MASNKNNLLEKPKGKFACTCCGKEFTNQRSNFFKNSQSSLFKSNNGFFHMCKDCTLDWYQLVRREVKTERDAIRVVCQAFDVYYSDKVVDFAVNGGYNVCSTYFGKIGLKPNQGKTYIDTLREDAETYIVVNNEKVSKKIDGLEKTILSLEEQLNKYKEAELVAKEKENGKDAEARVFWGDGYTSSEYDFMCDEYDSWIIRENNGEPPDRKTEIYLIQSIKMLIDIQRARKDNDYAAISSLTKTYASLLKQAGLAPEADDGISISSSGVGTLIEKWERDQPLPEIPEELKDVGGVKKYIRIWFSGHLSRMYGLKNSFSEEYENEIKKYEVITDQSEFGDALSTGREAVDI